MNSLNIISARVSPPSSPAPTRTNSLSALGLATVSSQEEEEDNGLRDSNDNTGHTLLDPDGGEKDRLSSEPDEITPLLEKRQEEGDNSYIMPPGEETPLLFHGHGHPQTKEISPRGYSRWSSMPKRITAAFINSVRWVLSTLAAPGVYLIACLYDEHGNFSPLLQLKKLFGLYGGDATKMAADYHERAALSEKDGQRQQTMDGTTESSSTAARRLSRFLGSSGSSSSGLSSDSESEAARSGKSGSSNGRRGSSGVDKRHLRSKSLQDSEEIAPARRSIRIKLHSDEPMRGQRKHRKAQSTNTRSAPADANSLPSKDISAQLKSPTSPIGALTKYPKTPAPPRPLIPRRQPSYINIDSANPKPHQKTLILDLDETLIHSMSKGGRMSSGHMVEVRLNTTYVGVGGQASIGPQHPILYYVHKRPHCDEFLRRVSRWFNLVVFTASVQEYADPVIDWLESDRKYFSARYYRQHCTFRHGAFIKDLSSVEPDLSKVMILDNSPLSYMFHQGMVFLSSVPLPQNYAHLLIFFFLCFRQRNTDTRLDK